MYEYSKNYEGSLQSSFFDFVYNKFDKYFDNDNLEINSLNIENAFIFEIIYYILLKDQPENLINKLCELIQV